MYSIFYPGIVLTCVGIGIRARRSRCPNTLKRVIISFSIKLVYKKISYEVKKFVMPKKILACSCAELLLMAIGLLLKTGRRWRLNLFIT